MIWLTATEARDLLVRRVISAESYAYALLDGLARSIDVSAWSFLDPEQIIRCAQALDRTGPVGKLFGLPVGVKDIILTSDMPTQYNSAAYIGFHPRMDAACVSILRSECALIFGKTETVEFGATGRPAPTRNPHDPQRTPGGSSSGSAAAVAAGHVPLALGTQTGGSIIRPASFCGVFGMKPSWGLVSREGAKEFAPSLDTVGWFARSVEDLALLYDALVHDPRRPPIPARPHIALCRTVNWEAADTATQAAFESAALQLRTSGCEVSELCLPAFFDTLNATQGLIMLGEGGRAFLPQYLDHADRLDPNLRQQVETAGGNHPSHLGDAYDHAATCRRIFDGLARPFNGVLTPSAVGEAPLGLAQTGDYRFNAIWSVLHTPCINLPYWTGPNGMPVGLTLTAPRFSDPALLATCAALHTMLAP